MADWRTGFWGLKELKELKGKFIVTNMPLADVFIALVAIKSIVNRESVTMKAITLFIAMLVLSISACAQKVAEPNSASNGSNASNISAKLDTTLPWLQIKIWDYQSRPVSNPPRSVIKTTFEGKPVYYVPAVCCDIPSELYAEDGTLMCYPSGGITGNGDGKCTKFRFEYLDNVKNNNKDNKDNNKTSIVWEDKRKLAPNTRVIPNLQ